MLLFMGTKGTKLNEESSAGREAKGPYFSELLYEIQVVKRPEPHGMITSMIPMRNEGLFNRTLQKKRELGEITGERDKAFESFKLYRQRLTDR
jgi:hypothetical protein